MDVEVLNSTDWFPKLVEDVRRDLAKQTEHQVDQRPTWQDELAKLAVNKTGWWQSLSDPTLSSLLRAEFQKEWDAAILREQELHRLISELDNRNQVAEDVVSPEMVADRLQRLADVLAANNPTRGNLELSLHIDRIDCFVDGRVVMRTCRLGALSGAVEMLAVDGEDVHGWPHSEATAGKGTPRRRGKFKIDDSGEDDEELDAAAYMAADPNRFTGLPKDWFWEDVTHVPKRLSWAERYARDVAEFRITQHVSMEATAKHFRKTIPTIRAALRHAKAQGLDAFGKAVSLPTRRIWAKENASIVAAYVAANRCTLKDAAIHFGKSPPTIKKALEYAGNHGDTVGDSGSPASTV